ncbi:MAG: hypothetical protein JXR86_08850 [Spirochaetales bacterium]|nr:hypothetical protein [Spirochaetales bacterium]
MKLGKTGLLVLLSVFAVSTLNALVLKAAVTAEPGNRLSGFFTILSEKSGIEIQQVPLLPVEFADALKEGLVDLAVLPDTEKNRDSGERLMPLWGSPLVLITKNEIRLDERNLTELKTIGIFIEDEHLLEREVIDKYSLDPGIQRVRHYDILVHIMAAERVSAIMIPMVNFERSLRLQNEDRDAFSQPFPVGFLEDFLFLSRKNTDRTAPSGARIVKAVEDMRLGGILEKLGKIAP